MGLKGNTLLIAQGISLLGFSVLNVALNFYNSWLLTVRYETVDGKEVTVEGPVAGGGPNFNFPVFYTMWHMVASVLGASVILLFVMKPETGFPSFKQFWDYKFALVVIAACTSLNIGCNNVSLTMVSLFLNQVIKATGPMPTMLFSVLFDGKKYGWGMILSCVAIVGATILAVPTSSSGPSTSGAGVIVCIISTLAASLKPVVMSIVMKGSVERPKLPATVVLFYDTFISFWFMLIYWLASAERTAVIHYIGNGNGAIAVGLIIAGASMAFMFNLCNYFFVMLTSALTTTVAANGVKVVNIVISAITTGISATRNWIGVALVCLALVVYAYFSYAAKGKPPPNLLANPFAKSEYTNSGPDAEAGTSTKATEGTRLTDGKSEAPECGSCCIVS